MKDAHGLAHEALQNPTAQTANFNSLAFDVKDYIGRLKIIQQVGAVSGTTPSLAAEIQDSEDGSSGWATVAIFAAVTSTNNNQAIGLVKRDVRRYIRYLGVVTGTTPSFNCSAVFVGRKQVS